MRYLKVNGAICIVEVDSNEGILGKHTNRVERLHLYSERAVLWASVALVPLQSLLLGCLLWTHAAGNFSYIARFLY